jgi:hypothetical protein
MLLHSHDCSSEMQAEVMTDPSEGRQASEIQEGCSMGNLCGFDEFCTNATCR